MKVEIISPSETLYTGEATAVTVPSKMGPFTLLEHHAAIVAILEAGKVSLTDDKGEPPCVTMRKARRASSTSF